MSIKVESISKLYGEQKALNNVSFEITAGEIVGFLGPNGAGKSTMMKIITCFIPPSDGLAKVCDFDVSKDSIRVRQQVGYLPEHNPLYLDMYVKEYLGFIAGLHKIKNPKERIEWMIEKVGLKQEQHKKIGALSKGYRQRVGLAQAMLHDPKVLILDEPTTGLDPNQIVEIRDLIAEIGKEKTVLMSTHIMQEVEAICDRVIIIDKGNIVADKATAEIKNLVGSQFVIVVEFGKAMPTSKLKEVAGVQKVTTIGENKFRLHTNSGNDVRPLLFQLAVETENDVLTLQKEEQRLEDVFKKLTTQNY